MQRELTIFAGKRQQQKQNPINGVELNTTKQLKGGGQSGNNAMQPNDYCFNAPMFYIFMLQFSKLKLFLRN